MNIFNIQKPDSRSPIQWDYITKWLLQAMCRIREDKLNILFNEQPIETNENKI